MLISLLIPNYIFGESRIDSLGWFSFYASFIKLRIFLNLRLSFVSRGLRPFVGKSAFAINSGLFKERVNLFAFLSKLSLDALEYLCIVKF